MAQEDADAAAEVRPAPPARRRVVRRALLLAGLLLAAAILLAWFERNQIADNILARELDARGIDARYRIERVSPTLQVLTDIEIGDSAAPDLAIERLAIRIRPRFGFPEITSVTVIRPRLYGEYVDGELSFGALDPLLFTGGDEPFELPDLALAIEDGRGMIETDFGRIGLRLAGRGNLRSGFAGEFAASAPALATGGCALSEATLYGRLGIEAQRPRFSGPLRFAQLECADQGLALAGGSLDLAFTADQDMSGVDGEAGLALGPLALTGTRLTALSGTTQFTWREQALTARYALEGSEFVTEAASAARLASEGQLRARANFTRLEIDGELTGRGVAPGAALDASLASAEMAGSGTLAAPLLARIRSQLARETRASTLAASFTARSSGGGRALLVPRAVLTGASGATLLSLTGGEAAMAAAPAGTDAPLLLAGDFATGGEGLPRIVGRLERGRAGTTSLSLAMAEYSAGPARLALPELSMTQAADSSLRFQGRLLASGPLPGGAVQDLVLPLAGTYTPAAGLALWPGCTQLRFSRLELADLALERDDLTLCPPPGAAIVRSGPAGFSIAAGAASLDLAGQIGSTPIAIASGPVGLAWPGALSARNLQVALGPADTASRFSIADLTAELPAGLSGAIGGALAGADISLAAVPLDLLGASGRWRYADGRLALSEGAFSLEDRSEAARFRPLAAEGASLALQANVITAEAALREPRTGALVTEITLAHDLATGTGYADLVVPGITFGEALQPTDLTDNALGVVALVEGTVTGSGRIDWNAAGITSTGSFASDDLDFAAAFGPVEGASGTITFTDLIGLTTAPNQRIAVRAVNPGIEIYDGEVAFQLRSGQFIDLQSARWPFLGGTLTMRPLTLSIGVAEERGYILDIEGLEAARFIERMELENISAIGTLDGTIPVIFDADGYGRIENGVLRSRPPGGNVAYVGELTYEDLTPMVNFAFDMLRSLDYRQMRIAMDGPLTGELVTQVALEGVSQGAGAEQNIITRRLARIPIRLVLNVRAPFYRLISSVRSLYDPSAVRDPRELGLIGADGSVVQRETDLEAVEALDAAQEAAGEPADPAVPAAPPPAAPPADIQPTESETAP